MSVCVLLLVKMREQECLKLLQIEWSLFKSTD